MKRGVVFSLFLFLICLSLFALGCSSGPSSKEYTKLEAAHQWVKQNVSRKVVDQLELPSECPDVANSVITWSSAEPKVIDNTGKVVTRPSETKRVELTYTIKIGSVSKEYVMGVYVSSKTLSEVEAEFLALIPEELTESIPFKNVYADGAVEVLLDISHENILKLNGHYVQPFDDTEITINYVVTDGNDQVTGSVKVLAKALGEDERIENTIEWLNAEGFNELLLSPETVFPSEYEKEGTKIYWESSNLNVVSNGKVVQSVFSRYVTMTATIVADNSFKEVEYLCEVAPLDTSKMTEAEILESFVAATAVEKYYQISFNQEENGYYTLEPYALENITQSYGFINFYGTIKLTIEEAMVAEGKENRPGYIKTSTEYITVHDTANNNSSANGKMHANYINGTAVGTTSWHYTVDETKVYHHIPDKEVAWHAGDGSYRKFGLIDTGLKATAAKPVVSIKDGYYHINGIRTNVTPYVLDIDDSDIEHAVAMDGELNKLGIICEIGENGNYFLGKTYFNSTYKYLANYGGNLNSIGIETCVNKGSDYPTTVRLLAQLVVKLLNENNLGVDRVKGHHYFSGKPCPNGILISGWWSEFLDLVAMEKFASDNLSDYRFTWKAENSLINSTGKISKTAKAGDEVKYSVKITKNNATVFEKSYVTVLA